MTYRIQMREAGSWVTLGGSYDAQTADERVMQFVAAVSHNKGTSREFRIVSRDDIDDTTVLFDNNRDKIVVPVSDTVTQ